MMVEEALVFNCGGETLAGILHLPPKTRRRAVLVVVGGPQYRAGSHRQFVLLARSLAVSGTPVMRFDYRGMGDSSGPTVGFDCIQGDIGAALDRLFQRVPQIEEVVLWGLCDAATAAAFYAPTDSRVTGLVLLNPWVRSEQGIARSYLRRYYHKRLLSADLWRKLFTGRFRPFEAVQSFVQQARKATTHSAPQCTSSAAEAPESGDAKLSERMLGGLQRFKGNLLIILSENDLTSGEFKDAVAASKGWKRLMGHARVRRHDLREADHTFSTRAWREQVSAWTREWLRAW